MDSWHRTELEAVLASLTDDTNFYRVTDVDLALDAVASTLRDIFVERRLTDFSFDLSLHDVLVRMVNAHQIDGEVLSRYYAVNEILKKYKYPRHQEIDDASDLESSVISLRDMIETLTDYDESN